jgi:chemotaxis protein MotB
MALARSRSRGESINYWPGFVDALSTLLLVIIFLLTVFMLGQFFAGRLADERGDEVTALNARIAELTDLLALERGAKQTLEQAIAALNLNLSGQEAENARLRALAGETEAEAAAQANSAQALGAALEDERTAAARAAEQIRILNEQIAQLRQQLAALEEALQVSETANQDSQIRIQDLGQRLNLALAQRVQELSRYRSEFFGRLNQLLGNRPGIKVVGDRFVFDAAVLFDAASDEIGPAGLAQLDQLAPAIVDLEREIPPSLNWVIRVDGHTDRRPLTSGRFPDNWALSAARATSVVKYLASKGISPNRLAAAGFGEFQPLVEGDTPEALAQNRRIEFKLTER